MLLLLCFCFYAFAFAFVYKCKSIKLQQQWKTSQLKKTKKVLINNLIPSAFDTPIYCLALAYASAKQ